MTTKPKRKAGDRQQEILQAIRQRMQDLKTIEQNLSDKSGRDRMEIIGIGGTLELNAFRDFGAVRCDFRTLFGRSPTRSDTTLFSRDIRSLEQAGKLTRLSRPDSQKTSYLALVDYPEQGWPAKDAK